MMAKRPHVVIAGGSGLIGTACRKLFVEAGYDVYILTRRNTDKKDEITWDPKRQWIAKNVLDEAAAVINLCGRSIADKRWTKRYKSILESSRTQPAYYLKVLIDQSTNRPNCYVGMSAIGIYGNQEKIVLHDDTDIEGKGFVPQLVHTWEDAHLRIGSTRNVILRTGVVLSPTGGFVGRLTPPAWFGLYPYFGNGGQLLSWIHIDDLARMILYCVQSQGISGVFHATAPGAVPLRELMQAFKAARHKPGILFGIPRVFMRLAFGEMSTILFESADVRPDKMIQSGFKFKYEDIGSALEEVTRG